MFIAALFTRAKTWKQPKCLLTEWIKKMCHECVCVCILTHACTHTQWNEIMPFAATWMYLEIIYYLWNLLYDTMNLWNLLYDTNELIYETETDP